MQHRIGEHARVTYSELASAGEPQDPAAEYPPPVIHPGERDALVSIVSDSMEENAEPQREECVFLIRSDVQLPDRAYRLVKGKRSLGRDWGRIIFALVLHRVGNTRTFREPRRDEAEYVAIKEIDKRKVDSYLRRGGRENPYKDIQRMQQIGDNLHVIKCIEALEDANKLYTIMPRCEESLTDAIPWSTAEECNNGWLSESHAASLFSQILQNLHYLQSKGICHHDLSPENMMLYKGRILFIDFAMSFKVPHRPGSGFRLLTKPQGIFGKHPYMAPEVIANATFDGFAIDLWSACVSLYNVLVTDLMFHVAHPVDVMFKYFIMAGALSNAPLNERTVELLMEMSSDSTHRDKLMTRVMTHMNLSHDVVDLLQNALQLSPSNRFTLAQCIEARWLMER